MNTVQRLKSILNAVLIPLIIFSLVLAPVMVFAAESDSQQGGGSGGGNNRNNRNSTDNGTGVEGTTNLTKDLRAVGELPEGTGVFQGNSLIGAISTVIQWALSFIGIVVFIIFLYAGFEYATAGGDEGKASTAQKRMVNAVIGLIIIFFAFVASNAVLSFVFQVD